MVMPDKLFQVVLLFSLTLFLGCGTTTKKLATEQLLISDAIDVAVSEIDFSHLTGQDVYLDTSYMRNAKGVSFANTDYIISSLRQQMASAGCRIQDDRNAAKIIVEPRIGALGTDGHEVNYGLPQTGQLSAAAASLSSAPVVPVIPEISFGRSDEQLAVAKIVLFAYERESKIAVWQSGVSQSESSCRSSWVLGAGPFQKGSIHDGTRFAGRQLGGSTTRYDEAQVLANIENQDEEDQAKDDQAEDDQAENKSPERAADAEVDASKDTKKR